MATTQDAHIGFMVSLEVRLALEERASEANTTFAAYCKQVLAEHVGLSVPEGRQRAKKYASEEEQKAEATRRRKEKQDQVNKAIEELKAKIAAQRLANAPTPFTAPKLEAPIH